MIGKMNRKEHSLILLILLAFLFTARAVGTEGEAGKKPDFSFAVIADVQYCDHEASGSRFYRQSPEKLERCVRDLNTRDLAFVIQLGDFIDRDLSSFDKVLPIFDELEAPRHHVLGNHEYSVLPEEKENVPRKLGLPVRYYDFARGSWRFVVLDGNDLSFHATAAGEGRHEEAKALFQKVKTEGRPQAMTWNGGVGEKQLAWLEGVLARAEAAKEKVIVFCHFPLHPPNVHNLWNCAELIEVIESSRCVAAYMNGHNHHGNYAGMAGVHYITFHGMVETEKETAYAIVEVYADYLKIIGIGREPSRLLAVRKP